MTTMNPDAIRRSTSEPTSSRRAWRPLAIVFTVSVLVTSVAGGQTRDSAGIRIIENPKSAAYGLYLASTPIVQIGQQPGEAYQLSRVGGAVRLTDGTIVLADGGSSQLRFYDSTGKHLRNVGRSGPGPGEFSRLEVLARTKGDTLVAGAYTRPQSFFAPTGEFIRQARYGDAPGSAGGIRLFMGVLDDQSLVMASIGRPNPPAAGVDRWVDSMSIHIVDRDGAKARSLGNMPHMVFARGENGPRPPWFGAVTSFATNGREIFAGFPTEYALRVYSADGKPSRIIRRQWSPVKVKSSDIDTYVEEWSKRWIKETGAEGERRKQALRSAPYADTIPAFSELRVAGDGRLWVRQANLADAPASGALNAMSLVPSVWSVFDREGRWLSDVTMPARFQPTEIGADYILGIARDGDGVETVAMYRYGTRR